jgi:hypothetical protein
MIGRRSEPARFDRRLDQIGRFGTSLVVAIAIGVGSIFVPASWKQFLMFKVQSLTGLRQRCPQSRSFRPAPVPSRRACHRLRRWFCKPSPANLPSITLIVFGTVGVNEARALAKFVNAPGVAPLQSTVTTQANIALEDSNRIA